MCFLSDEYIFSGNLVLTSMKLPPLKVMPKIKYELFNEHEHLYSGKDTLLIQKEILTPPGAECKTTLRTEID